jgi:hypothetical protein
MITKLFTLIGIALLLYSCDCPTQVNGKIFSSETNKPLSGAKIEMIGRNLTSISNKDGSFTIVEMTGFCYTPKIRVTYNEHKPFVIELEFDSDYQNYKIKTEAESIDFDSLFYPDSNKRSSYISAIWINKYSGNFKIKSDSLIIYLDEKNLAKEIELIKRNLQNKSND